MVPFLSLQGITKWGRDKAAVAALQRSPSFTSDFQILFESKLIVEMDLSW
jgi:hypothetical protein